jgi:hypothetical protein
MDFAHARELRDVHLKLSSQFRTLVETGNQNPYSAGRGGENLESERDLTCRPAQAWFRGR